jgi:hypothetical protein
MNAVLVKKALEKVRYPNMARDPIKRRKRIRLVSAVLAVGIIMSFLVAVALIYMGQTRPRF